MNNFDAQREAFKRRMADQPVIQQRRAQPSSSIFTNTISTKLSSRVTRPTDAQSSSNTGTAASRFHEDASILTRVHQIIEFLKKSQRPCTTEEIQLHIHEFSEESPEFQHLSNNAKVIYSNRNKTFAYRPEYDIRSPEELVEYLRKLPDRGGLEVKKLADSYLADIPKLVLAITEKDKDNRPRYIFYNHMMLDNPIDDEMKASWKSLVVPEEPELGKEMKRAGLRQMKKELQEVNDKPEVKKAKRAQRITKITNQHLGDLLDLTKDYTPDAN
ncbi:hypothetical protein BX661DRAFT_184619 [Kickxella alabastrina]|uniref:uncharacterized protein n=1 Tax=Kickxella alabastrina TaxID=61397 RepID=UPI00221EBD9B|nr:uncharacterized protein BX661DRAFT_184619 [Kickxella alabastrina]KAI7825464.1 hypothetical protein BX661DRAFT_184619 [Kickxella alabastrina]